VRAKYDPQDLFAIKKIPLERFKKQILREIQIFHIVRSLNNECAVNHFDSWIEKSIDKDKRNCTLFIIMNS
jgi:hypothetical protein